MLINYSKFNQTVSKKITKTYKRSMIAISIVIVMLITLGGCLNSSGNNYEGVWFTDTSIGSLYITLCKDETYFLIFEKTGATQSGKYEVNGNDITLITSKGVSNSFTFKKGSLVDEEERVYKKVISVNSDTALKEQIIGSWRDIRTNATLEYQFNDNDTYVYREKLTLVDYTADAPPVYGVYEINGKIIKLFPYGEEQIDLTLVELNKDDIVIKEDDDEKSWTFKKR